MFGNITIALIFSLGAAGWIYSKMNRQTGGNSQTALIVAGLSAAAIFVFLVVLLGFIPSGE